MEDGKYNRDVNCLRDRDKSTRISGLQRILNAVDSEPNLVELFVRIKANLIELLADPTDKCKELAVKLLEFFVKNNSIPPEDIPHVLQGIHNRVGVEPSLETCEEVRIGLVNLLFLLCKIYSEFIHIDLQRVTDIVAKGFKDKCPIIKILSGEILAYLSCICKKLGFYARKILENCIGNLYHQQYKVRINCLQSICGLVQCEGAYELVGNLYKDFKKVQLDRRSEVADMLNSVVFQILKAVPSSYLAEVEGKFCYLLLSGEKKKEKCLEMIEEIGVIRNDIEQEYSGALQVLMKNLKEIISLCLKDLQEWTLQDNYKTRAGCALLNTIEICKKFTLTYADEILPVLFRTYSYEPTEYLQEIIQVLGYYCDLPIIISLFSSFCNSVNSSNDISSALTLLSHLLSKLSPDSISPTLQSLITLISSVVSNDEALVLHSTHKLIALLLEKFQSSLPIEPIFQALLILDTSAITADIQSTINLLAANGGITIQELYLQNLALLLPKLIRNYKYWDDFSSEPARFARLLCRARWCSEEVIQIVGFNCKKEGNDMVKSWMLDVVEHCVNERIYSQILIEDVFISTAAWRPNGHLLRRKSVNLLNLMLEKDLIDPNAVKQTWDKILPVIKTCCNDEQSELRGVCVKTIQLLLEKCSTYMDERETLDIYPEILKRLDDSSDIIRISACVPFVIYFKVLKEKNMRFGNFSYVVNNLFTHLDDPSDKIQKAIGNVLQAAAGFNKEEFLVIANEARQKHKHPRSVGELIEIAKSL